MALVLNVIRAGLVLRHAALSEKPLSIGRGPGCGLAIDDSPREDLLASVRCWNGEFLIVDEDAEVVVVGSVPVRRGAARVIRPGDSIQVDGVELRLQDTRETTQPVASSRILMARGSNNAAPEDRAVVVRVAEGPSIGRDLCVKAGLEYVIGRHRSCNLVLDDMDVSRRHLRIRQRGTETFIEDVGSSGGTQLGTLDLSPGEPTKWEHGIMVRLGRSVIALDG